MDDDKLLEALLTHYAGLAEDASEQAATALPRSKAERLRVISTLSRSASNMLSLAEAARVIVAA